MQPQPQPNKLITPQLVLDTLRHWWLVATPIGLLLAAAAGAGLYVTFEPEYQAKVLLRIREEAPGFPFDNGGGQRNFAQNQIALVRSSPVLGPVVGKPEIFELPELSTSKKEPVETLAQLVAVSALRGSDLYHLTCTSKTPRNAALIANAVAESYLNILGDQEAKHAENLIQLLEEERLTVERNVRELRDVVREMTRQQTGRDPYASRPELESPATASLAMMRDRLMSLQLEYTVLDARVRAAEQFEEQNPLEISDQMVDDYVDQDPELQQMKQAIWSLDGALSEIKSKSALREKDRLYVSKLDEKGRLERALAAKREDLRRPARGQLEELMQKQRSEGLQEMRDRRNDFALQMNVLEESFKKEVAALQQFSGETLDLAFERQKLARAEGLETKIADRVFMLKTQRRAPARVELLERAAVPVYPLETTPIKKILMAGAAVFMLPFGLAFLWELSLTRVSKVEQLESTGHLKVLGETARFPVRAARNDASANTRVGRALRTFEESVDSVRMCITLAESIERVQVLGITSATSQEGKTTLAAQLAVSIAKATGEPTLLIDADMRAPDMHEVFDVPLEPGLCDLLSDQALLDDVISPTWMEHLDVLPAGRLDTSPHKLLGNGRLTDLMQAARRKYRYIVLDTPPVLAASESLLLLSRQADATVICTMRDVSRMRQVNKTNARLVAAGARVVGCVFNGVPQQRYAHTYGRYYYQQ